MKAAALELSAVLYKKNYPLQRKIYCFEKLQLFFNIFSIAMYEIFLK